MRSQILLQNSQEFPVKKSTFKKTVSSDVSFERLQKTQTMTHNCYTTIFFYISIVKETHIISYTQIHFF